MNCHTLEVVLLDVWTNLLSAMESMTARMDLMNGDVLHPKMEQPKKQQPPLMKKQAPIIPVCSWVESVEFAIMSVLLFFCFFGVFFAFFASGDATERFYVFLYPQKCGEFF